MHSIWEITSNRIFIRDSEIIFTHHLKNEELWLRADKAALLQNFAFRHNNSLKTPDMRQHYPVLLPFLALENLVLKCGQSRIELLSVLTDGFPSWLSQKPCKYDSIHCGFFVVMPKIRTVKTACTRRREIFEGFFLFEMQSGWRPTRRKKGKAPKRACVGR